MPSPTAERAHPPAAPLVIPQPAPAEWSDEVKDIMSRPPSWLLRSGTSLLMGGVMVLLLLGWFIRYPDMISGKITLMGSSPVVDVVARQSGHLASLKVKEMQAVKSGDILAIISSPADAAAVLALTERLAPLGALLGSGQNLPAQDFKPAEGLGQIQPGYAAFASAWSSYQTVRDDNYAAKTARILEGQTVQKQAQITGMEKQSLMADRERALETEKFARMKALHQRDSISSSQVQEAEQQFIGGERVRETARKNLAEEKIALATLEKEMADQRHQREESLRLARYKLQDALNLLRAQIDLWQADYLLRASSDGVVAFHDFWSDQQYVTAGQVVFLIVPETTRLIGRMSVNQSGAGKIIKGQPVRIKLQDFPYKEFGLVDGRVESISMVARDSSHIVLVEIAYPLTSSYGRPVPFKQQMTGEAGIVTEDVRLIGRVFNEIRKAFAQTR